MGEYIGPRQAALLVAMKRGQRLYQEDGRWYLIGGANVKRYQNRERCMGLFVRGFITGSMEETRTRYTLTVKGEFA